MSETSDSFKISGLTPVQTFSNSVCESPGQKTTSDWMEKKAFHGQFLRETESSDDGNRWKWLKRGELKCEKNSVLRAASSRTGSVS